MIVLESNNPEQSKIGWFAYVPKNRVNSENRKLVCEHLNNQIDCIFLLLEFHKSRCRMGLILAVSDRFHLIIPEIRILASGNQVSEFLLPFNHLYQACSGPGLREVPVDTFQLSGSRKICISFGNLEDENGKTES